MAGDLAPYPAAKVVRQPAENGTEKHRRCVALHGQDRLSVAAVAARVSAVLPPCRTISMLGATTAFWGGSTSSCWLKRAKLPGAKPAPRPGSSTANPSRPPRAAAPA